MIHARRLTALFAGLLLSALLSAAALAGPAVVDLDERLKPDPSVVMGRLPNGLRYAIKQQAAHQTEIIDFYVDVGSLEEGPEARGAAHFLEHMAFNGSRRFPAATLMRTFEEAGIGFGRDQNAVTNLLNTTYILKIPNENSKKIDLGFNWLRDVADGLLIDPAEVDRERGVIQSEFRQGEAPQRIILQRKLRFLLPGLKFADRLPISDPNAIQTIKASTLRDFYAKWYRPENVIVVAAGDEPVEAMRRRIEVAFSDWRNPTPAPARVDPGRVEFDRPSAGWSFVESHLSGGLGVCRYSPKPDHRPEDVRATRDRLADQIWSSVFAKRMGRLVRTVNPPFLLASGVHSVSMRTVSETCFSAVERQDDWKRALGALWSEIGRLERYGITRKEFEDAKAQILANDGAGVASAATRPPEARVASILENMIEGDTFDTEAEQMRVDALALQALSPEAVSAQFAKRWTSASPPLFFAVGPSFVPPESLLEVAANAPSAPPPVDVEARPWAYGDAATPGAVVRREARLDPDFVRIHFANGLVLNFKQTRFSQDSVSIRISFGAGQMEVPPGQAFDATIAGGALQAGALERNDATDIAAVCQNRACGAQLQVTRTAFSLNGSTRPGDLAVELQLLTAFLKEPGFRPGMAAAMPTIAAAFYRTLRISPALLAAKKLEEITPPPHASEMPPEAHVAGLDAPAFKALLKGPLTSDPLEATIVGDVDEQTAVAAVARTLGALPARTPGDRTRPDAVRLRFAQTSPPPVVVAHQGAGDQAFIQMTWPVYVWTPARAHESRALNLLARVMKDQIVDRVRQALGKSYAPAVSVNLPRGGDQGSISVGILTTPGSAEQVRSEVLKIAGDLAARGVSPEAFARARAPWLEALAKERTYNGWWLGVLDESQRFPDKLEAARDGLSDLKKVTLEEVNAAARRWLARAPYVATAEPNAPADGRAPATPSPDRGAGLVGAPAARGVSLTPVE